MEILTIVGIYLIVSISLAWTSYFTIFRPAINLLEEILDKRTPIHTGVTGFILWTVMATIHSPFVLLGLLKNDNKQLITDLALHLGSDEINGEDNE